MYFSILLKHDQYGLILKLWTTWRLKSMYGRQIRMNFLTSPTMLPTTSAVLCTEEMSTAKEQEKWSKEGKLHGFWGSNKKCNTALRLTYKAKHLYWQSTIAKGLYKWIAYVTYWDISSNMPNLWSLATILLIFLYHLLISSVTFNNPVFWKLDQCKCRRYSIPRNKVQK